MSDNKSRGLGKGLDALFNSTATFDTPISTNEPVKGNITKVSMHLIDRNLNQPRQTFDGEKLDELANSIKEHGVLQPIMVTEQNGRYLLVAGERRWRASKLAGLKEIPVVIKQLTPVEISEIALIENLQRDDLNPIEEAKGIKNLMSEFGLTQEEVSKQLSKSRSAIANTLRLLTLPDYISQYIINGKLSAGHGRCLVGINNENLQSKLCQKVMDEGLNVRQLEKLVKDKSGNGDIDKKPTPKENNETYPEFTEFQDTMQKSFGMKVDIKGSLEKGKITISYSNRDELEGFYDLVKNIHK